MSLFYDYLADKDFALDATVFELSGVWDLILDSADKRGAGLASELEDIYLPYKQTWVEANHQGGITGYYMEDVSQYKYKVTDVLNRRKGDDSNKVILLSCPTIYYFNVFLKYKKAFHLFAFFLGLNNGKPVDGAFYYVPNYGVLKDDSEEKQMQHIGIAFAEIYQALMLMNCKNISYADHEPKPLTKKQKRRGEKRGVSFKTIVIDTDDTYYFRSKAQDPKNHNALHMCRGHFVTYTDDNKLFGKYTGRYWRRPHLRGKNKDAVNINDYKLIGDAA